MWSGLGIQFGHLSAERDTPATTVAHLTELYNVGFRKIRVVLPAYTYESGNVTERDKLRVVCETALDMGFYVIWGYTVNGVSVLTNATMTGAYHDALVGMATWAETLENKANFEINLGNEDDERVNGTDCTKAQYQAYVRGALADDVKAAAPSITVSYATSINYHADWKTGGLGSLDKFALNIYAIDSTFQSHVRQLNLAWGSNGYISEFNSDDDCYDDYNDDTLHAYAVQERLEYIKKWSIPSAYFFGYTFGADYQKYASKLTNNSFRGAFAVLAGSRKRYT